MQGASSAAAGLAAGLILFAGILTRPVGGMLARPAWRRSVAAVALIGVATGSTLLALEISFALAAAGALLVGLAAGLPFAIIFAAAQRARPDAPAAAIALVNGVALATILVGTPLAGLTFGLPGDGRLAFAAIAVLSAAALLALRTARL